MNMMEFYHLNKCLVTVVVIAEVSILICLWFLILYFILQLLKKCKCRELESCDHRNIELFWVLFSKLF